MPSPSGSPRSSSTSSGLWLVSEQHRLGCVARLDDAVAVRDQRCAHEPTHLRLVFDDEHQRAQAGHASPPRPANGGGRAAAAEA